MSGARRSPNSLFRRHLSACLIAAAFLASCAGRPAIKQASPESLRRAVCYLASDSLEGRLVGTPGIDKAAAYIADEMASLGLKPLFGDSYFQDFTVDFGFEIERTPIFRIGDAAVDYSVLPISGSAAIWAGAVIARDLVGAQEQEDSTGIAGKVVFLIEDPSVERDRWTVVGRDGLLAWMRDEAQRASDLRASAIVFVSGSGGAPVKDHGSEGQAPEAPPGEGFHIFAVQRKYTPAAIPCLEITYSELQRAVASQGILFEDFHRAIEGDSRAWTEIKGLRCELGIATRPKVVTVRNVGGLLEGCARKSEYVVVGAHFDGLGRGDISSATPWRRQVYPGADDNASGVGALLEIAREVVPQVCLERSVAFVAFTAEELGALGSEYFCNHPPYPLDSTVVMINLDTVGRLENRQLIVFGARSALELDALLKHAERATKLKMVEKSEIFGFSDQNPFYASGIPSTHLFTGAYSDYHTPDDGCANLNFPGLAKISEFASRLLLEIANSPVKLTLVEAPEVDKGAGGQPAPAGGRGGFLGIVPDFAYAGEGVGIKGTMPKSPAEAAGLRQGDVLTAVDGKSLVDLKQLMTILSGKQPGDEVTLDVRRGGSKLTVRATIGVRAAD